MVAVGEVEARLDLNTDPFNRKLGAAKAKLESWVPKPVAISSKWSKPPAFEHKPPTQTIPTRWAAPPDREFKVKTEVIPTKYAKPAAGEFGITKVEVIPVKYGIPAPGEFGYGGQPVVIPTVYSEPRESVGGHDSVLIQTAFAQPTNKVKYEGEPIAIPAFAKLPKSRPAYEGASVAISSHWNVKPKTPKYEGGVVLIPAQYKVTPGQAPMPRVVSSIGPDVNQEARVRSSLMAQQGREWKQMFAEASKYNATLDKQTMTGNAALRDRTVALQQVATKTQDAARAVQHYQTAWSAPKGAGAATTIKEQMTALRTMRAQLDAAVRKAGTSLTPVMRSDAAAQITAINSQLDVMKTQLDGVRDAASKSEGSMSTLWRTVRKAAGVFIAIMALKAAIQGVASALRAAVAEAARFEQLQIGFRQLYGGAAKAKEMLADLAAFAMRTPFELRDTEQAALRLRAYGFEARAVIPMLSAVGDASSALGTGAEGINRITLALGQMRSAGRMNSRDMLQLTESFVPAWEYVAEATGKTTAEIRELSEQGLVPASVALEAILKGMRRDFGGMMSAQMDTLIGQWSNFVDTLTIAGRAIGEKFLEPLKRVVAWARERMPYVQAAFEMTLEGTNDLGASLKNIGTLIKTVWDTGAIQFVVTQIGNLVSIITGVLAMRWKSVWEEMKEHPIAAALAIVTLATYIGRAVVAVGTLAKAWWGVATAAGAAAIAQLGASNVGTGAAGAKWLGDAYEMAAMGKLATNIARVKEGAALLWAKLIVPAAVPVTIAVVSTGLGYLAIKIAQAAGAWQDYSASAKEAIAYTEQAGTKSAMVGPKATWKSTTAVDREVRGERKVAPVDRLAGLSGDALKVETAKVAVDQARAAWQEASKAFKAGTGSELDARAAAIALANAQDNLKAVTDETTLSLGGEKSAAEQLADALKDIRVPGLDDAQSSMLNLYNKTMDVAEATRDLAVAQKESGAGSVQAQAAELQLTAARGQLAEATRIAAQAFLLQGANNRWSGEVAEWAANVVSQGAAAIATALDKQNRAFAAASRQVQTYAKAMAELSKAQGALAGRDYQRAEQNFARASTAASTAAQKIAALEFGAGFKAPEPPKLELPGGSSGGAAAKGANKIADAIQKLRDLMTDVVQKAKDLAARFKEAAVEAAGAAGAIGERPESRRGTRGIAGALRSQIKKLEKYRDSLLKLKGGMPQALFEDFVIPASVDDVIGMARLNFDKLKNLLSTRAAIGVQIANVTQAPEIRTATGEIAADTYKSAKAAGVNVQLNFGGVTIGTNLSPEEFARRITQVINVELRAAGVVV